MTSTVCHTVKNQPVYELAVFYDFNQYTYRLEESVSFLYNVNLSLVLDEMQKQVGGHRLLKLNSLHTNYLNELNIKYDDVVDSLDKLKEVLNKEKYSLLRREVESSGKLNSFLFA